MQYMRYYATTSILNVDWSGLNFQNYGKVSVVILTYIKHYMQQFYISILSPHTLGEQMIYLTAVTCIPRSLWPENPLAF